MEINSRYLTVRGKLEIDQELSLGQDIQVTVTVTNIDDKDNDDSTIDRTYRSRLFEVLDN